MAWEWACPSIAADGLATASTALGPAEAGSEGGGREDAAVAACLGSLADSQPPRLARDGAPGWICSRKLGSTSTLTPHAVATAPVFRGLSTRWTFIA